MRSPVVIVFVDCLAVREAALCDWMGPRMRGAIASGIPRVTPQVISGILTGQTPPHHGVLCPTRLDKPDVLKPRVPTLLEMFGETKKVLNYEMPLTHGIEARHLLNVGESSGVFSTRPPVFQIPRAGGKPWKDDIEQVFQAHVDYLRSVFGTMRNVIRNNDFDVVFLSIRDVDTFGHFYFKDQRSRLIQYIDIELEDFDKMGDVPIMFFSDHGITDKTHAFYINKWLIEQGWLELEVWMHGVEKQRQNDDDPMEQVGPHSPFVHIREVSCFVSGDAYDSGITVLREDAPIDELKAALMETGMYAGIYTPEELYGDGPLLKELGCDVVCDRADGVLVSGNMHPALTSTIDAENYCQCKVRTGVHDRHGVWGSNKEWGKVGETQAPGTFHHTMKRFIETHMPVEDEKTAEIQSDPVAERLADLGYI